MDNPELYSKCTVMSVAAAIHCLDKYAGKMNWKETGDNVVDLGCGDGSVSQTLKKYIPPNYTKFVGCDISEKMVKYASSHDKDERSTYRVFDIDGELPFELKSNFDHVFSFFTLQWMRNEDKAFRNIYDMLTEGGDCLLSLFGYTPMYNLFDTIGRTRKWSSSWLKDLGRYIPPYYNMENMEAKVTEILEAIGFTDVEVKINKMTYMMDNWLELRNTIKAVEPYNMPTEVFDEFMRDCVVVGKEIGLLEPTEHSIEDYNKKIEYNYDLIVIYAKKPYIFTNKMVTDIPFCY